MKKVLALVLVLVMVLATGVAMAEIEPEKTMKIGLKDTREVKWEWSIPAEMIIEYKEGDPASIDNSFARISDTASITNAMIQYAHEIVVAIKPVEGQRKVFNKQGDGILASVSMAKKYPTNDVVEGKLVYAGNEAHEVNANVWFHLKGDVSQIYIGDYTADVVFTCTYMHPLDCTDGLFR